MALDVILEVRSAGSAGDVFILLPRAAGGWSPGRIILLLVCVTF
jgi:hypothetical protein